MNIVQTIHPSPPESFVCGSAAAYIVDKLHASLHDRIKYFVRVVGVQCLQCNRTHHTVDGNAQQSLE